MCRLIMVLSCETEEVLAHTHTYISNFITCEDEKEHLFFSHSLSGENVVGAAGNQLNSS